MSPNKRVDSSSQMEVEKLIVDYLTYEANTAVINEYASGQPSADNVESAIENAESWASIFRQHFPGEKLDSKASFRAKLLHLTVLVSQRTMPDIVDSDITSSLEALRTSHGKRRSHFTQSKSSSCPLSRSQLAQLPLGIEYRAHHIQVLRDNGSTEVDPALAKLVPLLCKLSAYRGAMDSNSTSTVRDWMNCVGQLMLQAALEMLLVHGISEADVLREIFSWTWKADSNVDEMYPNQHEREVSEWDKIKAGWAGVLSPPSKSTPLAHHLLQVAASYPLQNFERDMMNFLATLHNSVSKPRLSQVEDGRIEGLSAAQSSHLLRRARVAV